MDILLAIIFILGWGFLSSMFSGALMLLLGYKFRLPWRPLTHLVGSLEVLGVAILTNFYLSQPDISQIDQVSGISLIIGGWFAIKSLNHPIDSQEEGHTEENERKLTNTELKYKFVLGTVFSLLGGVILGILLNRL